MGKQLQKTTSLSLTDPKGIMNFGKILKNFIVENKLSTKIGGTDYAHVDGWKFAAMNFGLVAIVAEPEKLHATGETMHVFYETKKSQYGQPYFKAYMVTQIEDAIVLEKTRCEKFAILPVYKYKCSAEVINVASGKKVGFGTAICTSLELIKSGFDEYAVASMAQTRAIGKALRNLLGFIMNTAGFSSTPAEEMSPEYLKEKDDKVKFDSEVEGQVALLNTIDELKKYWEQNPELHKDIRFSGVVNKRKKQLEK